jgi:hypothetical protein
LNFESGVGNLCFYIQWELGIYDCKLVRTLFFSFCRDEGGGMIKQTSHGGEELR